MGEVNAAGRIGEAPARVVEGARVGVEADEQAARAEAMGDEGGVPPRPRVQSRIVSPGCGSR